MQAGGIDATEAFLGQLPQVHDPVTVFVQSCNTSTDQTTSATGINFKGILNR